MAKKKNVEEPTVEAAEKEVVPAAEEEKVEEKVKVEEEKTTKTKTTKAKYPVGSIVYVSKNADADLNGFKLFPQYKKYTYTVEAYDEKSGVYTLRKLNLSLSLKEDLILAPEERADDHINRLQF